MKTALFALFIVLSTNIGYQIYLSYGANYCKDIDNIPYSFVGFRMGCYLSNALEAK